MKFTPIRTIVTIVIAILFLLTFSFVRHLERQKVISPDPIPSNYAQNMTPVPQETPVYSEEGKG